MSPLPARPSHALAVLLASFAAPAIAQVPSLPTLPNVQSLASGNQRYVDYSRDLDDPNLLVVVARLGPWKEGKRERLADGQLGGGGAVTVVSGTQFFRVPVQAPVVVQTTLLGQPGKTAVGFDVQVARLPDGTERRQLVEPQGLELAEGTLALFVLQKQDKKKTLLLCHVLPFDPNVDKGPDGELQFAEAMRDVHTVNRRVHALTKALAAYDQAEPGKPRDRALADLTALLEQKPEMKQPRHDALLLQHTGPLEERAKKRLDEAKAKAKEAEQPKAENQPKPAGGG